MTKAKGQQDKIIERRWRRGGRIREKMEKREGEDEREEEGEEDKEGEEEEAI